MPTQEEPSEDPSEPEPPPAVDSGTLIARVLAHYPDAARVLYEEFGLPCFRCPARRVETLAEGLSYCEVDPEQVLARLRGAPT